MVTTSGFESENPGSNPGAPAIPTGEVVRVAIDAAFAGNTGPINRLISDLMDLKAVGLRCHRSGLRFKIEPKSTALTELVEEAQAMGFYDDPPGPRSS